MEKKLLRVDQLLARFGYCSRRDAFRWVRDGRVCLEGEPLLDAARRVDPATVTVDDAPVDFPRGLLVALHKPSGCVCSHDDGEGDTIYDFLPGQWLERHPAPSSIGRLDKETSGLLLITDDGDLSHRLTSPRRHVEKVYEVEVDRDLPADIAAVFARGDLVLRGETAACLPAQCEILGPRQARLTVQEGKYHQVRRMFASQGVTVTRLHRTRIGRLELGDLAPGKWRAVTEEEVL